MTEAELGPEDLKIITLARSARARVGSAEGAAVRDETGRTYAAAAVALPSLRVSALTLAVAMAVSSGAVALEAAALVSDGPGPAQEDIGAVKDIGSGALIIHAGSDGAVREILRLLQFPGPPARPPRPGRGMTQSAGWGRITSVEALGEQARAGDGFSAGFACFAGRPNVGKSTLTNALVGTKVAITSSRPQTTRRVIRGIVRRPDAELIVIDTPGLHRPRTLLGERLDSLVRSTLSEVDVIGFCVPAADRIGPGDKYLAAELTGHPGTPVVAIVTKIDQASRQQVAGQLSAVADLGDWADIVPVSAVTGFQLDVLTDVLVSHLPPGRPLYPDGELTDEPEQQLVAELIREAILEGVRDELPHSIAVVVEEMAPREGRDDLIDVHAVMYVERQSQKAIVIGAKGARLREVGSRARKQIEALLGSRVYLDLRIKVAKDWQRDPRQLRRLGFYD